MSPVPGSARARRRIRAKRLVVRSVVGALVGVVLLVATLLVLPLAGAHPSTLGVESLLWYPGGGALLMNVFGRSRPARLATRLARRLSHAVEWIPGW